MLTIMAALDKWQPYLLGAAQPFEIWTDHLNLQYFWKPQKLNYRQARWILKLFKYNFKLFYKPGALMTKADLLLRQAGHKRGENDNSNITLLKPKWFNWATIIKSLDTDFLNWIKRVCNNRDRAVAKALAREQREWEEDEDRVVM